MVRRKQAPIIFSIKNTIVLRCIEEKKNKRTVICELQCAGR